jgi:hypothetical protein
VLQKQVRVSYAPLKSETLAMSQGFFVLGLLA